MRVATSFFAAPEQWRQATCTCAFNSSICRTPTPSARSHTQVHHKRKGESPIRGQLLKLPHDLLQLRVRARGVDNLRQAAGGAALCRRCRAVLRPRLLRRGRRRQGGLSKPAGSSGLTRWRQQRQQPCSSGCSPTHTSLHGTLAPYSPAAPAPECWNAAAAAPAPPGLLPTARKGQEIT